MENKKNNQQKNALTVESLFLNQVAPERIVLAGMKGLENELTNTFRTEQENRSQAERHNGVLQKSFLASLSKDAKNKQAINALKQLHTKRSRIKLAAPKPVKERERIFTGLTAATVVPPFNYQWTWHSGSGFPDNLDVVANRNTGTMNFFLNTNPTYSSSDSHRTALGIFFKPLTENGVLRVSAAPAINFNWWDTCAFASAHTDAFMGLYVGRYNLNGEFDGSAVNQQISIWNDSSWWSGGSGSGSNSGFPLSAQFNVDGNHWYALWIWCGGNVSSDGWHTFSGSGAGAALSVAIPSVTWELF